MTMSPLLLAWPLKQTTEQPANSFSHGSANGLTHLRHRVQKLEAKKLACGRVESYIVGRTVHYKIRGRRTYQKSHRVGRYYFYTLVEVE